MDWIQILQGVFIAAISAWLYYQKQKEKRETKALGLADNPTRCQLHKEAVDEVKRKLENIERDIGDIRGSLRVVRVKLNLPEE